MINSSLPGNWKDFELLTVGLMICSRAEDGLGGPRDGPKHLAVDNGPGAERTGPLNVARVNVIVLL